MSDPQSVEEWLMLVEQSEAAACLTIDNRLACSRGYQECGFAVEYMLKAYIMRKERFNSWPTREARKDLYTHDLRKLKAIAGITSQLDDPNLAEWLEVEEWDRSQGYSPKLMPRKKAKDFYESVFGKNGVVTWLRQNIK